MSLEEMKQLEKPKRKRLHAIVCFEVKNEDEFARLDIGVSFLETKTGDQNRSLMKSLKDTGKAEAERLGMKVNSVVICFIQVTGESDE